MPVTFVDRLPLPNLKVYTAGSVSLLSIAVYYALSATSDPNWRNNAARQEAMEPGEGPQLVPAPAANDTRNVTEQFVDVMTFMMQEPLCMWTLINIAYCSLAVLGHAVLWLVFGELRVAEAQHAKDMFWNYVFHKFIFVFGVINVQYVDEMLLWCSWFALVGCLHVLGQLCKDRYEYLSSSPSSCGWAQARLACLLAGILAAATAMLVAAVAWGLPAGPNTFAFMSAECVLVALSALHASARMALTHAGADVAGARVYYSHLAFESASLLVELAHVLHMVVHSNMLVSIASLVLLLQLRHLLHELQARLRRYRVYSELASHMSRNYPMASKEEIEKNQDNCAICWDPMKEARKLPCSHLFHNSCLCQWVQQDASCPTCRRVLAGGGGAARGAGGVTAGGGGAVGHGDAVHPNHLFHFDGSRYASWLPSLSVEVSRARGAGGGAVGGGGGAVGGGGGARAQAALAQLLQVFPQHSRAALQADLARTREPDRTLDNILEGRLPPDLPAPEPPAPAAPVAPVAPATPRTATPPTNTLLSDFDDRPGNAHRFSRNATERESLLQKRKEKLIEKARRRYLEKLRPRSHEATPPAPHS